MMNKTKVFFVIIATGSFAFVVLMSTQFSFDIADQILSTASRVFTLHQTPMLLALTALVVPGMYLVFNQRRRP
jgi:hypothetical protein